MASIAHLMNRDVIVQRAGQTADGQGGFSESFAAVSALAGLKGRRQAASGRDRIVAGREEGEVSHIWYFDGDVTLRPRDKLVSGSNTDEVVALANPSDTDHTKVLAKEIQLGAVA